LFKCSFGFFQMVHRLHPIIWMTNKTYLLICIPRLRIDILGPGYQGRKMFTVRSFVHTNKGIEVFGFHCCEKRTAAGLRYANVDQLQIVKYIDGVTS